MLEKIPVGEPLEADDPQEEEEEEANYVIVDGEKFSVTDIYVGDSPEISCGRSINYNVFENSKEAGKAARRYFEEMADHDLDELRSIIGDEVLIQWGLGQHAGPGDTPVKSLEEWLDLWLNNPEDHWASYDGDETEGTISAALADEINIKHDPDDVEVTVVLYRR
jgi:hypothetical protein